MYISRFDYTNNFKKLKADIRKKQIEKSPNEELLALTIEAWNVYIHMASLPQEYASEEKMLKMNISNFIMGY